MKILSLSTLLLCLFKNELTALNLPGPLVYVVTPSPRPLTIDEGRSAPRPFYYHNWLRRMDSPPNTTTTSTTTPRVKTPDLIFAEFESDKMKNIRNFLEKERIDSKVLTTAKPIYVLDKIMQDESEKIPPPTTEKQDMTLYNNLYNSDDNLQSPIYVPSSKSTTQNSTTETPAIINNVENIWHIIDSEKYHQSYGGWKEVPVNADHDQNGKQDTDPEDNHQETHEQKDEDDNPVDENFALPGFGTNPVKGVDDESRAIRTEPNNQYPYGNYNFKKPPMNSLSNSKKGNNMYTNLDNFYEIKNPVRGEAQDVVYTRQPIDRYNPAQPYLPSAYGSKSKQSIPSSAPVKANLVPPPPPPPPKVSADDFPAPVSYESFPPYAQPTSDTAALPPPPAISKPSISPPVPNTDDDSETGPGDSMDLGYRYKPPASSGQSFLPTVAPLAKPFGGYSYDKPTTDDVPPSMETDDKPDFEGYHYEKPAPAKPDFQGYHNSKPAPVAPPMNHPPTFDHGPPSHDNDYPELIFDKPHGGKGGNKGADDDIGMVPPPPSAPDMMKPGMYGPPMDDNGFPQDFPGGLKFHHDFDDHDFYHHHHHPTTTTTTTEMPRVDRYSYYFLGKKLYYLPLYFSVYFIIYVGALIIKAVLRHKIAYPNSFRPNKDTAAFFSKRSVDSWDLSNDNIHEMTGQVTHAIATAAKRYMQNKDTKND